MAIELKWKLYSFPLVHYRNLPFAGFEMIERKLSAAPMMGFTDRHCRYLFRLLAPNALLYSEMLTTGALIYGDASRFLKHHPSEQPSAFQLGGNDPDELADCARMVQDAGFSEVNLNLGCPSDRVQSGKIGACLMNSPELVAECIYRMRIAVDIPVTVKCRIGIDSHDSYEFFAHFVDKVSEGGCLVFIVHARKALLTGLSAKENRQIPPLKYDYVYRIKKEFPHLTFILNGGLTSTCQVKAVLPKVDGIMIGREAYHNPVFLAELDSALFETTGEPPCLREIADQYLRYVSEELAQGVPLRQMARHLLVLFRGVPGAKEFRRQLSEALSRPASGIDSIQQALGHIGNSSNVSC
jgi:tRNA-dihydrouridine synthase A